MTVGEIASFTYGYTDKAADVGDARFIRITDIDDEGRLNPVNAKYITSNSDSEKYLLRKGDLLMARTGATYGKTLYVPNDDRAVYASFLIKITFDQNVLLNRYYWHFAKSTLYWRQAEKLVSPGAQQQFNTGAISKVRVPVPTLEQQRKIVQILDRFDVGCSDLASELHSEIAACQKQYDYYRNKLFTFKQLA